MAVHQDATPDMLIIVVILDVRTCLFKKRIKIHDRRLKRWKTLETATKYLVLKFLTIVNFLSQMKFNLAVFLF